MQDKHNVTYKVEVAKRGDINPVALLLIFPILGVLALVIGSMLLMPGTFYTFKYQLIVMFGLGFLWLLCQFVIEKE